MQFSIPADWLALLRCTKLLSRNAKPSIYDEESFIYVTFLQHNAKTDQLHVLPQNLKIF